MRRAAGRAADGEAAAARPRGSQARGRPRVLPDEVGREISEAFGPSRAPRMQERLAEAARDYERDRYRDAVKLLKPLSEAAPGAPAVRELHGLALYRLGRWKEAIRELEAYRALTGSWEQHPTLMDCYRAKARWAAVEDLWRELKQASPGPELMAEGRIVLAGALADRGRTEEAIEALEQVRTDHRRPRPHHVRVWYALADLYERAGDIPRARSLFREVVAADPETSDAADRLAGLA